MEGEVTQLGWVGIFLFQQDNLRRNRQILLKKGKSSTMEMDL